MSKNLVTVLFDGYSRFEEDKSMCANGTCTLVRSRSGDNIVIDTMSAWDGAILSDALEAQGLSPAHINIVACTHGHPDHTGCNYLFPAATNFWGSCAYERKRYYDVFKDKKEYALDKNGEVVAMCTPGHTLNCISIIVYNSQYDGVVGICGDLFENGEDIDDETIWLNAGTEDERSQRRERLRMAELCKYIVPGHGGIFEVTQQMRQKLRLDAAAQ